MSDTTLESIDYISGVNEAGEGFVTIAAHGKDGTILLGQLTPDEIREHGLCALECAEAADQDAAVLRVCRKLELPDELAGAVITELRNTRGG